MNTALNSAWGALLPLALLLAPICHADARATAALHALSDNARVRLTWLQDHGDGTSSLKENPSTRLCVMDSRDGIERSLLPALGNYSKPLMTPDGQGVVYMHDGQITWTSWSGTATRKLVAGTLLDVWRDPATRHTWVVYAKRAQTIRGRTIQTEIARCRLDAPATAHPAWNASPISRDNFQLSRDGRAAAGLTPWPAAARLNLATQTLTGVGRGCWTSMCPDNSYIMWVFDGPHRNITLYPPDDGTPWTVPLNTARTTKGWEVYHPRWSNHPRYLVITGPYKEGGGTNRIRAGGPGVELYLGRFTPDLRRVERWVQVTSNSKADFFPDAWIEGATEAASTYPQQQRTAADSNAVAATPTGVDVPELSSRWPATEKGLVYVWEGLKGTTQIREADGRFIPCEPHAWGHARFNRHMGLRLDNGGFEAPKPLSARLFAQCRQANALTLEAIVTPRTLTQTGPARIISFSESPTSRNFTLGQERDRLVLRLRTPATGENGTRPEVTFGRLQAGKPVHVVISYQPDDLRIYLDGKRQPLSTRIRGDFSNWTPQRLCFGNEASRDRNWDGDLQGVALYARAIDEREAAHRYALQQPRIESWTAAERFELNGILASVSPLPANLKAYLGEYSRALRSCVYISDRDVDEVAKGERFIVRHWSVLDRKPVPLKTAIGQPRKLILERIEDHPEVKSERLLEDLDEDDLLLPVYLAIE